MKKRDLVLVLVGCAVMVALWPRPKPEEPQNLATAVAPSPLVGVDDLVKASGEAGYQEVLAMKWPPVQPGAKDLELGKELYSTNCAACHGPNGLGDGPAGVALDPKPNDLTKRASYKLGVSRKALYRTIKHGVKDAGMAPWDGRMTEQEMHATVLYLQTIMKD